MQRLREPMQDHIANSPPRDSSRNVVELGANPPELPNSDPLETLEVLAKAVNVFMNMERRAIEIEARAKSLVERAVEKLHLAESRIRFAEEARHAAEENLDSANAELLKTKSRFGTVYAQLKDAEERTRAAEMRAMRAENAFRQLDNAIRTQLVGLTTEVIRRSCNETAADTAWPISRLPPRPVPGLIYQRGCPDRRDAGHRHPDGGYGWRAEARISSQSDGMMAAAGMASREPR